MANNDGAQNGANEPQVDQQQLNDLDGDAEIGADENRKEVIPTLMKVLLHCYCPHYFPLGDKVSHPSLVLVRLLFVVAMEMMSQVRLINDVVHG